MRSKVFLSSKVFFEAKCASASMDKKCKNEYCLLHFVPWFDKCCPKYTRQLPWFCQTNLISAWTSVASKLFWTFTLTTSIIFEILSVQTPQKFQLYLQYISTHFIFRQQNFQTEFYMDQIVSLFWIKTMVDVPLYIF